jgi:hypothetical protein
VSSRPPVDPKELASYILKSYHGAMLRGKVSNLCVLAVSRRTVAGFDRRGRQPDARLHQQSGERTNAVMLKVKQEFAAKEKARKATNPKPTYRLGGSATHCDETTIPSCLASNFQLTANNIIDYRLSRNRALPDLASAGVQAGNGMKGISMLTLETKSEARRCSAVI